MTCWSDGDDREKATARLVMQRTDCNMLESIMSKMLKPTLLLGRVQPGRPLGSMSVLYQWRYRQNDYTNSLYSRGSIAFACNMVNPAAHRGRSGCVGEATGCSQKIGTSGRRSATSLYLRSSMTLETKTMYNSTFQNNKLVVCKPPDLGIIALLETKLVCLLLSPQRHHTKLCRV